MGTVFSVVFGLKLGIGLVFICGLWKEISYTLVKQVRCDDVLTKVMGISLLEIAMLAAKAQIVK